jgi:hypothetical protein
MPLYLRNLETGKIVTVDPDSAEFQKLKAERTNDERFPLYEQTSSGDADPKQFASSYEVENRERWNADIADVTTDGILQSGPNAVGDFRADAFADAQDASASSSTAKASK